MAATFVPAERVRRLNDRTERPSADFVLYWMQAYRRAQQNWALTAAIQAANQRRLPLVVYHELDHTSPWASDRLHRFLLEGIAELGPRFARRGIRYHFYLRRHDDDPADLLPRLAKRAALVVTDDFPVAPVSDAIRAAGERLPVPLWAVDGNGIVPLAAIPGEQYGAYTLRPRIRRLLPAHLRRVPEPAPRRDSLALALDVPETPVTAESIDSLIAGCAIDHGVPPSPVYRGGDAAARARLRRFVAGPLKRYAQARNEPGRETTSRLSPYLHCGQIAVQEVALAVRRAAGVAAPHRNAFLEELIVRRELAYNFCWYNPHHRSLDALPRWARETLRAHARDRRPTRYAREEFEAARTHDYLWNAIQAELLTTGLMFGYYRMYWGKKIIEWSRTPAEAQATMIALHEKYALDGRDANTYSNILWCFGKHDRPWSERPIFGKVRYMSLAGTESKTDVAGYLDRVNRWCREAGRPDLAASAPARSPRRSRSRNHDYS